MHEDLHKRIFAAVEIDVLAVDLHGMSEQVEADARVLEHRLLDGGLPPDQRADAREQLLTAERLGHVVVGAVIESFDPILDRVARTENQDRLVEAALAPLLE